MVFDMKMWNKGATTHFIGIKDFQTIRTPKYFFHWNAWGCYVQSRREILSYIYLPLLLSPLSLSPFLSVSDLALTFNYAEY